MGSHTLGAAEAVFWLAVALVTITSTARITRLLTFDLFPPIRWARDKFAERTDGSDWQLIAFCPYCMSFWVGAAVIGTGWLSDWHTAWWLINAVFGSSYLAAMLMVADGDDDGEDD